MPDMELRRLREAERPPGGVNAPPVGLTAEWGDDV